MRKRPQRVVSSTGAGSATRPLLAARTGAGPLRAAAAGGGERHEGGDRDDGEHAHTDRTHDGRDEVPAGPPPGLHCSAMRRLVSLLALAALASGCSSSSGPAPPKIAPARVYKLAGFAPAGTVRPGRPTAISFAIDQPSGKTLTDYRTGSGPHTGVHLIVVRDDLSLIIHRHPPLGAGGRFSQRVVFPLPGRYRVIVDAYPKTGAVPNFQLFRDVTVAGPARAKPLGPYRASQTVGGFRFVAPARPRLRALQAGFLQIRVTDAAGRPARFVPWYGALAHAIFFRQGTLDYFHTHVCGTRATGCATAIGGARISGTSTAPGTLNIGVLLPAAGTWRLFVQARPDGHLVTAPYTLRVR